MVSLGSMPGTTETRHGVACNPRTGEVEAGGSRSFSDTNEFKAGLDSRFQTKQNKTNLLSSLIFWSYINAFNPCDTRR